MQANSIVENKRSWLYGAGCLLCVEVFIAAFLHDRIVRPYVGDLLAVVFLYCLVRSVVTTPVRPTVAAVLLGNHFEWGDMLAYTLGAAGILAAERVKALYEHYYA
jgi:uncharacterized membrane protein YfcA